MTGAAGLAVPRPAAMFGLLLAGALVLYGGSLRFGFTFDDADMVANNPLLASFDLGRIFSSPIMPPQESAPNDLYRPVGVASLAADHAVGGGASWAYRASNVVLHALVSWLVLATARAFGASEACAALAATFFLVHPIHSEVVLQIKGRFELLAAAFGLGAVLALGSQVGVAARFAAAALLWIAAMLAKESALGLVVLVPVVLATRGWAAPRAGQDRAPSHLVAAFAASAACALAVALVLALRLRALGALARPDAVHPIDNPLVHVPGVARVWSAFDLVWRYARLCVLPVRLSADYSFASIEPHWFPSGVGSWLGLGLVIAGLVGWVRAWRARDRLAVLAWTLIAGPYLVVSNALLPIGTVFGERLVYLPSAGVCLLVARGIVVLADRAAALPDGRRRVAALTALVVSLFAARAWARVPDWSSNLGLFQAALDVNPRSAKMLAWVGRAHLERDELEPARELLARATEIAPEWFDPRVHLARTLVFLDRVDEAEQELDAAAAQAPPGDAWVPYHRGLIALRREHFDEAAHEFEAAAKPPWEAPARFNRAFALLRAGAPLDAATAYLDALARFPADRRVDRELPRLREALAALTPPSAGATDCAGLTEWANGWLATLDRPGLLGDRLAHGAPPRVPPCGGTTRGP